MATKSNKKQIEMTRAFIDKRVAEVGKMRDKLREDMDELEGLLESVNEAHESMLECRDAFDRCIQTLSQMA